MKQIANLLTNIVGYTGIITGTISLAGVVIAGTICVWLWAFHNESASDWGRLVVSFLILLVISVAIVLIAVAMDNQL